jgi:hypothetical protein
MSAHRAMSAASAAARTSCSAHFQGEAEIGAVGEHGAGRRRDGQLADDGARLGPGGQGVSSSWWAVILCNTPAPLCELTHAAVIDVESRQAMTTDGATYGASDPAAEAAKREERRITLRAATRSAFAVVLGGLVTSVFTYLGLASQFANERNAQIEDTRRSAYVDYLQSVQAAYFAGAGTVNERELETKEALVLLLGGGEVREVAPTLADDAVNADGSITAEQYTQARNAFIEAAQREREAADAVHIIPW